MPGTPSPKIRQALTLLLLAAGAFLWWQFFGFKSLSGFQASALLIALILSLIPAARNWILLNANRLNANLATRRTRTAVIVALVTLVYLLFIAWHWRDNLFLKVNDEHAYMIQARMLSGGKLWMHAYPPAIAPFFDALCLISDRVYASMYFPGTALAEVPFVWLHLPFWLMPVLAASISAGLLYALVAEIFDPLRGLVAVLLFAPLPVIKDNALLLLSELPFLVAALCMLHAWLSLRKNPGWKPALILGLAAGFAAITRPLDAVCFALPIGIAIAFQHRSPIRLLRIAAVITLAALPFLLILLIQNIGVTGHWNEFAETYFTRENYPAPLMGFYHPNLYYIPPGMNAVKQQWLRDWILESFRRHTFANAIRSWHRGRLPLMLDAAIPNTLLRILLPVAILSLTRARRWVIVAPLLIFALANFFYLFLLPHYVIAVLPLFICLVMLGFESIRSAFVGWYRAETFLLLALVLISFDGVWRLPAIDPKSFPDQWPANQLLAHLSKTPAVVLFRFDPRVQHFHDDPVYNDSVAWPDDASVIRARDLGPQRNRALVHYYAQRQPDRMFYIYDPDARYRGERPVSPPLGTARQLDVTGTIP